MEETKATIARMIDEFFGPAVAALAQDGKEIFVSHGGATPPDGDYLDSLDRVELVMAVEDRFGIDIPETISATFKTLDQVAEYVDVVTRGPMHGGH